MDYRLDDLGWYQFERLCQSLLRVAHGANLQTWGGSHDQGREAYSTSDLRYPSDKIEQGPFVFQVKFVSGANAAGARPRSALLGACRSEAGDIAKRLERGLWDEEPRFYTLMTNVPLTPSLREDVEEIFSLVIPESIVLQMGGAEICAELDNRPAVRNSYPQVLGLRDLQQLIARAVSADVVTRSDFATSLAMELSRVFVPTSAYSRTLKILDKYSFAVLLGPPEMGKTAIARLIGLTRYLNDWEVFDCRGPDDLFAVYQSDRPQFFIADDAFGSTEYRSNLATEWAADLERILARMDKTHVLVWTTRPGPLNQGLRQLNFPGASGDFQPKEVLVDASRLSVPEKAQILYRHTKAASGGAQMNALIKSTASDVINSPHFTPLRIGLLVKSLTGSDMMQQLEGAREEAVKDAIDSVLEQRTPAMMTAIESLSDEHRAILISMLGFSGRIQLDALESSCRTLMGRPFQRSFLSVLEDMQDHFIVIVRANPLVRSAWADWVHPSMRDCCIEFLRTHDADRALFLSTASTEAIVLALSSAGGSEGRLEAPLVVSEHDWATLSSRVAELAESASIQSHVNLLSALLASFLLAPSNGVNEFRVRRQALASNLLARISATWDRLGVGLTVRVVETYYDLAARCDYSGPFPDLTESWTRRRNGVMWGNADYVDEFEMALTWYAFLERIQPELITRTDEDAVRGGEATFGSLADAQFTAIRIRVESLEHLDPEEVETFEEDLGDGELIEGVGPAEPSSIEEDELTWLESVANLLKNVPNFIVVGTDVSEWQDEMEAHLDTRDERKARYELFRTGDPDDTYDRGVTDGGGFNVSAFFSDL